MSKADKMFEELDYVKESDYYYHTKEMARYYKRIRFIKDKKQVIVESKLNFAYEITIPELKAINEKVKELRLGGIEMEDRTKIILGIIGGAIAVILIIVFASIAIVPTGSVGIKVRFGAVQDDVIAEGLNFKAPFIENVIKIDCKTKKIETSSESSTKDMQTVNATIVVNYNVLKDTANTLYQTVGTDYEKILIQPAMLESIKSAMAQYTAEELITKRAAASDKILETLKDKLEGKGFEITGFNLTNVSFSDAYNDAIEAKAVAQQATEKAKEELAKAQIENQKKIENAKADAEVMKYQNKEITDKTLALKELEIKEQLIQKWSGHFPTTMLSDNIAGLFNLGK